jgi:hypothetical protein
MLEKVASEKGFCLGDVEVKISVEGSGSESVWLSPSTSLAPNVPVRGPAPPAAPAAVQLASGDGVGNALLRSVLDLQHQAVASTAPWVEEWSMGAWLDQPGVKKRDADGYSLKHFVFFDRKHVGSTSLRWHFQSEIDNSFGVW